MCISLFLSSEMTKYSVICLHTEPQTLAEHISPAHEMTVPPIWLLRKNYTPLLYSLCTKKERKKESHAYFIALSC